jgi:hypothetical protein
MTRFKDIETFSLLLAQAIAAHDRDAIDLAVDTMGAEFRDLAERFPDHRDAAVSGALVQRRMARAAVKDVVISLRRIAMAASAGDLDAAAAEYKTYYSLTFSRAMPLLRGTEPWSLFNPALREAHDAQRRQMLRTPRGRIDRCRSCWSTFRSYEIGTCFRFIGLAHILVGPDQVRDRAFAGICASLSISPREPHDDGHH